MIVYKTTYYGSKVFGYYLQNFIVNNERVQVFASSLKQQLRKIQRYCQKKKNLPFMNCFWICKEEVEQDEGFCLRFERTDIGDVLNIATWQSISMMHFFYSRIK